MAEKRYLWLKLSDGFFRDKVIKKLRRLAGGDTYTIIYLEMLLLAMNNNNCISFDGVEDDVASEIALELDEDVENVQMALAYLLKNGLVEQLSEQEYELTRCEQMVGSESASARRVRKHRENVKALHCNDEVTTGNVLETICNTEKSREEKKREDIEKEVEGEKEKEKEKEKENIYNNDNNDKCTKNGVQMLQQMYNKCTPEIEKELEIKIEKDTELDKEIISNNIVPEFEKLKFFGKAHVVMLSDKQVEDLLDKLTLQEFDYYIDKLGSFIVEKNAIVKSHYKTILSWVQADRMINI